VKTLAQKMSVHNLSKRFGDCCRPVPAEEPPPLFATAVALKKKKRPRPSRLRDTRSGGIKAPYHRGTESSDRFYADLDFLPRDYCFPDLTELPVAR